MVYHYNPMVYHYNLKSKKKIKRFYAMGSIKHVDLRIILQVIFLFW